MSATSPQIAYARSGDVHVAYQVVGDGPIDIVLVGGFVTNLEVLWENPGYRRFCERLASFSRLLLFDKRGMGLSDRVEAGTLEERMDVAHGGEGFHVGGLGGGEEAPDQPHA